MRLGHGGTLCSHTQPRAQELTPHTSQGCRGMMSTHIHRKLGTGSGTSCCHTAASGELCQQNQTGCEGRKRSRASPQPGFDPTDPAWPAEIHQGCCSRSEQQFLLPGCGAAEMCQVQGQGSAQPHPSDPATSLCPCHIPLTLPWLLDPALALLCPCVLVPLVAAAVGRAPVGGAALGAGGAGGFAGAGLPHGGQDSPWSVHQVLGHCRRAERSISCSLALPWAQGATERDFIGKCSILLFPRRLQQTKQDPAQGNMRRKEREQRALMRENHC